MPQKVLFLARPFLFGTTIVNIFSAAWFDFLFGGNCRRARTFHKSKKSKIVRLHFLWLSFLSHYFPNFIKKFL
ncbi:MAG: hypothetical protein A3I44_01350 [Candidatus Sungbacteria bacterium RIFCSPLOWO2_02_FULL_51_17]|uniref:Uncharacterized protein n=1 Tax=Candidatus Sungbacteria bacterium RIFCSPHIGHO2_02_FULL_51_29 TaxID=1802273 RepID=A0A1G2KVW4_9BACT|nr:MAG: hypothetical protein A2676_03145 [Candidatus Sungbacteria bacterium RIFCSPHIGHO2_01_FULL_51_22]OHA03540.1 MAG: hypothetical protein A3C16_00500 [Candidatus Sungbacteria bacterium RIFCSPHIGHO2_02_FULL_51_29]OHA10765.1 MAG: hypothetical protein A3I44_01350 [Candidatus Sungbacteria bacterium RIFCSPLOWO2_02_FULL_51_17]